MVPNEFEDNDVDKSSTPDYARRSPQVIDKNKKRVRELEWQDTRRPAWVAWISVLCLIIIVVSLILLSFSNRVSKPMHVNGDQLGPMDAQGQQYEAQAAEKLKTMEGTEPRWALMTTQDSWTMPELADVLRGFDGRVSTLYFSPAASLEVPEPIPGHTRLDTLQAAAELQAHVAQIQPQDIVATSALIYGSPEQLLSLSEHATVEPAPEGATFGRIGIRPVMKEEQP